MLEYVYQYKDHLRNIRLSYADSNDDGIITVPVTEVFNDGLESATGWNTITAYDSNFKYSGNYSGKIEKLTSGEKYVYCDTWIAIDNTEATNYKFSGWIYSNGPSSEIFMFMKTETETNLYTSFSNIYVPSGSLNQWNYIEKTVSVPANMKYLGLRVDNNGGGTVWFDNIKIEKVNNSSYSEIIEENNYYPFGLKHKGYNANINGVDHKFEFQGQESQEELDLNWISFKYRNHDPALGRFFNIDPLAEDYSYQSPYNFSENRVVDAIELEGLEKLDYRKVFNSGVNKVNSSVNRVVNNNTYGESQRQMALSQTTNSQQINDIKQSGTDESMLALKEFNEGSSGVARGGSVIVGDGLDDVGSSISKFGYAAAPFTEGASLSLVPIGDGMTGIGKSMKITVYAIDGDTDAVKQEGGEMIFNYGVSKLVSKAVTTTKSLENVTPKELNITEGILGTVGSWFSDAWKTITGGDE